MTKQRFIGFVVSACIGLLAHAQVDSNLITFHDALEMMQTRNPGIQRAQQELKQKEYDKAIKEGLYFPKVSVSVKALMMSDPLHLDLTDVRDAITPIYDVLGNYGVFDGVPYVNPETGEVMAILNQETSTAAVREQLLAGEEKVMHGDWDPVIQEAAFASVSADFMWPIFTGGKIAAANKVATAEIGVSKEEIRKTEAELLNELVTRYYGLVLATQVSDVMKEKYEAMDKHAVDARKMFDEGMIAKVELLSATVAMSDAKREYQKAVRMVETIRSGLTATLAGKPDTCFVPVDQLFVNKELPALDDWKMKTLTTNPSLKQIEYKKEMVELKNKVSKGNYLPTVALIGTVNLAEYEVSPLLPKWMLGAGMNWTLFNGMARQNQIRADQTLRYQVGFIEEKAQDDLTAYITKLHNQLMNQLAEIDELENTLHLASEYALSTRKAFNEGFANSTSVVEAQSKLAQVKALRLKSFYEFDVTLSSLLQISGTPEEFQNYANGSHTIFESIQ